MTDQLSPWRNVASDLPDEGSIVLACTERGALVVMWLTERGDWQTIHPMEPMPLTRRKPRDFVPDPPVHWMEIPTPPWDPTWTQR